LTRRAVACVLEEPPDVSNRDDRQERLAHRLHQRASPVLARAFLKESLLDLRESLLYGVEVSGE